LGILGRCPRLSKLEETVLPIVKLETRTYFLIAIQCALFGTVFVFSKQVIPPLNTVTYFFLRSVIGTIFLSTVLFGLKSFGAFISTFKQNWKYLLFNSLVLYTGSILLVFAGTPYTTASHQVIINNFYIVIVILISTGIYHQKPSKYMTLGSVINFIGIMLLILPLDLATNPTLMGDLITIGGVILAAVFNFSFKKMSQKMHPLHVSLILCLFPGIFLLALMLVLGPFTYGLLSFQLSPLQWFYICWLGIGLTGLGNTVMSIVYKDKAMTPERMGFISTLYPIIGVAISVAFFGESLTVFAIIGMILVLSSLFIANITKKEEEKNKNHAS